MLIPMSGPFSIHQALEERHPTALMVNDIIEPQAVNNPIHASHLSPGRLTALSAITNSVKLIFGLE